MSKTPSSKRAQERPAEDEDPLGRVMKTPEDIEAMLLLKTCSVGVNRIAQEVGRSHRNRPIATAIAGF